MKVYVSEKEEDYSALGKEVDGYSILEICNDLPIELVSLEQHNAEIKAPLLEEIEKLKTENYQLKQAIEFGKSSYAILQEQLELVKQRLVPAPLSEGEYALHYLSSDRIRKQAKQEVIDELEEWMDKDENCYIYNFEGWTKRKELKQKLNEMKEVWYE
ncbi:MAG: hypothetical protein GX638_13140 [Crenarchaeota archaeon]|nr:hypothetical protein [Thermoproteota archaeon]